MEEEAKSKKQPAREPSNQKNNVPPHDLTPDYLATNCPISRHIQYALCLIGHDGSIISVNPYMELLTGLKRAELAGKNITDLITHPSSKELLHILNGNKHDQSGPLEVELKVKEGGKIWCSFNVTSYADERIKGSCLLAGMTDITDHRRILEELSLCTDVLDAAPDAIFLQDVDGTYLYANETACKELGYSLDEILKLNLFQLIAPESQAEIRGRIRSVFTKGKLAFYSVHIRKDGTKFPAEVHLSTVEHGNKKLLLSIVHNITRRKKVEEELKSALKMESIALISSGIASKFNTLLTHILGNLNVLISESEPDTPQSRLLEETVKKADKAHEMVRHLASLSLNGVPLKKVSHVGPLLKDTAEYVLEGSNTWSNFFIADNLYPVELDQAQFIQAFSNIILNASQSMPKGGVINVSAHNTHLDDCDVSNLPEGEYIKITVTDRGHGISPEDLPQIFDPYFTTRQGKAGLGLSIAYSIIRNHGGTIVADSVHGKGSSFQVYLPAISGEAVKETSPTKQRHPGVKILMVDDEAVVRTAGNRILSKLGYDLIDFAADGLEALQKYKKAMESGKPYDVVIADLTLPGEVGGKELVKALHALDNKVNLIVSSGYFNDPILTDFHRYGIKGVLAKPYQIKELEMMLHEKQPHHDIPR